MARAADAQFIALRFRTDADLASLRNQIADLDPVLCGRSCTSAARGSGERRIEHAVATRHAELTQACNRADELDRVLQAQSIANTSNKGHRVCVALEAEARHNRHQSSSSLRETLHAYYSLRNRLLYVRKHHAVRRTRLLAWWGLVGAGQIANALRRRNLPKARAVLLGLTDGYAGRYGNRNAPFV